MMAHPFVCPQCNRRLPNPKAIKCPSCGASLTRAAAKQDDEGIQLMEDAASPSAPAARPKGRRKKGKKKQKAITRRSLVIASLSIGGVLLFVALLVGGLVLRIRTKGAGGGRDLLGGATAVIDELPDPPPAEDAPQNADEPEVPKSASRLAWTGKPDPAVKPVDYSNAVGAATPEQSILLAALGGPYVVGVPIVSDPKQWIKNVKTGDPAKPWKVVPLAGTPSPVVDIRTGKEVGTFPAACKLTRACRLSSDGQYLAGWQLERDPMKKINRDVLAVWKRGDEQPVLRWPVPGPVFWMEFIGPDRLALGLHGPAPRFIVLKTSKAAPVVSVPLPGEGFQTTPGIPGPDTLPPFTNAQYPCGAVSPGGTYAALAGKGAIVVFRTDDGRTVGRLSTSPEAHIKDYWALAFDEAGTELRAGYEAQSQLALRIWSMTDGQIRHTGPFHVDKVFAPVVLSGPEPGTLILGQWVVDLESGKPIAEVPGGIQRWAGRDHYLAQLPYGAVNAKALEQATDYQIMGGSFLTAFKRSEYRTKAAAFAAVRAKGPVVRPQTSPFDRTKAVVIRPQPGAPWAVKASPSPPLPADHALEVWPEAFAATEAAVVKDGRSWVRYDLKTGKPIGQPIRLWPDNVTDVSGAQGRLVALSLDGQRLAVVDPIDRARLDVWDVSGKRLLGLRPYSTDSVFWLAWSSGGLLLTACGDRITGWDAATGEAVFEIEGGYKSWTLAPGWTWLLATTPGGNLDFFDAASGLPLGRIPGPTTFSLAPDGKTLVCQPPTGPHIVYRIDVWDLGTGKRARTPEVPIGMVLGPWVGPRCLLRSMDAQFNTPARYLLYDLDVHTHTYAFAVAPPIDVRNDSLGRAWMARPKPAGDGRKNAPAGWGPVQLPGTDGFRRELAFGPGSTIRVEIDVGNRTYNQKIARQTAELLQRRGLKIGRDGWLLRTDYTVGEGSRKYAHPSSRSGKETISVASLTITWKLIAPDGVEVWQGSDGGSFDPFRSKYVKVGSRKSQFAPGGGGFQQVELDYDGKDAQSAQIEEILEQTLLYRPSLPAGLPACIAKNGPDYEALPIKASWNGGQKP
jgi:hypothetical protein